MKSTVVAVALKSLLLFTAIANAEEIVTLSARDGTTQSFLLASPERGTPEAAVILFPGGVGAIRLRTEGGVIRLAEGNFVVRSRQMFVDRGIATAVVDAPSDQSRGMDDSFRLGEQHATDITRISATLKSRFPGVAVFLVGTSRGTISAAAVASAFGDGGAGIVLSSTLLVGSRRGPGLSKFDYSRIKAPVLLVHHAEDGCNVTPYHNARSLADKLRYPLITVNGGNPPTSEPCEAQSAHGYLGKEMETVDAIVKWMLKKPYPANIE